MVKYSKILGLAVLNAENGSKIGNIKDIIISPKHKEILGYIIERKKIETCIWFINNDRVLSFGDDALIVENEEALVKYSNTEFKNKFRDRIDIIGLRLFTNEGNEIGIVKDIVLDINTARVDEVVVSDGVFKDIVQGRTHIPLFGKVEFGEENIIVGREATEESKSSGRGIKKLLIDKNKNNPKG